MKKPNDIVLAGRKNTLLIIKEEMGIETIKSPSFFLKLLSSKGTLLVTKCTSNKFNIKQGTPKQLYTTFGKGDFDRMVNFCEKNELRYGVLSGKGKGLLFDNEIIPYYDQNPDKYEDEEYLDVNQIIKNKASDRNIDTLIIYGSSPLRQIRPFRWAYLSGLKIYYISKLFRIKNTLNLI